MASAHIEILVEPFKENQPGTHVVAAIDVFEAAGLVVEMGPFATMVDGDLDVVIEAVRQALTASFASGAERIQMTLERT